MKSSFQALVLFLGLLTGPAVFSQLPDDALRTLILKDKGAIGIPNTPDEQFIINSHYKDEQTGIQYIYIQQSFKGLKVFNHIITLAYKEGTLVYSSGKFINNIAEAVGNITPRVLPSNAILASARHLKIQAPWNIKEKINRFATEKKIFFAKDGIAKKDIETELLWVEDDRSVLHLAWNVNIDLLDSPDWWNVRVDANSGEVINKDNWTIHERNMFESVENNSEVKLVHTSPAKTINSGALNTESSRSLNTTAPGIQNATYQVVPFPFENRSAGIIAIENNPWTKAGATNNATTYGWHFDGVIDYLTTRGNNVHAYEDSLAINSVGRTATSSTPAPFVTFQDVPDFTKQPYDSLNRNFSILNLFYWNNLLHDISYQYGFTESSGNFQADNLGRGGSANDYVKAEAQDGSGLDNANFSTPPDGSSGRMQMYLWNSPLKLNVLTPSSIAGNYNAKESGFSINNKLINRAAITGDIALYNDASTNGATHDACISSSLPLTPVAGKIAVVFAGACDYTIKARSAQNAGAIALIVVNNFPGSIFTMGGIDNSITIPAIMISQADGMKLINAIPAGVEVRIAAPIMLDGDIDNGIIIHEFAHGVSNRLTGGRTNASCLSNAEQAGEGWSDYLSLMLTTDWKLATLDDGAKPRPIGTYVLSQSPTGRGIRRVPYTTDMTIDTLTYKSLDGNTTFGNGEVHNIGEVWCSALWDMTWNIIKQEAKITKDIYQANDNGGNAIALKLVMEGMKLQPCRPGFLDSRNAILAADSILYQGRYKCAIWKAFARRGMGYSAIQGLSTSTADQTAAFDVPSGITMKKSGLPIFVGAGNMATMNINLTCQCELPSGSYTLSDTIPGGFSYLGSNGGTIKGNVVTFSNISFNAPSQSVDYFINIKATDPSCTMTRVIQDDRFENMTAGFVSEKISGTTDWVTSANRFNKTQNSWFAANTAGTSNFTLTSASFTPTDLSILSFSHYFVTENRLDGGKLEISRDEGASWQDAAPYFLQNGYNTRMQSNAPQPGTAAFSGTSYSTGTLNEGQFIQSLVDLSSFNGQPIRIRFRFQTNSTNAVNQTYHGWYIDDIVVTNGCGGVNKGMLVNANGVVTDSTSSPLFIIAAASLPLHLLTFTARQAGMQVVVHWSTSNEVNTKIFHLEKSIDGFNWSSIGSLDAKGSGNHNYEQVDNSLLNPSNFYRLKMVDKDGKYSYSPVRIVQFTRPDTFSVIPNPAINHTTIYFGRTVKAADLLIIDMQGRVLQKHFVNSNLEYYLLNTSSLPAGTYLLKLQLKTGVVTKKLVVDR